jgi:XTP/dITP diphosphohydrolase
MKILIATRNKNKIKEIADKFSKILGVTVLSPTDIEQEYGVLPDVIEDGTTFAENALKKARELAKITGFSTMADDSGLVVDALGGEPGVYSARYAGEGATDAQRNAFLLEKMKDIPPEKRQASFVCSIALVFPDKNEYLVEGICEGYIALEPKGAHGFGYDPIFFLPEYNKTMAELPLDIKNTLSHRAKALEKAAEILKSCAE